MKITVGENIRRLRREKSITQEELAEMLNISATAVSKWERSETYPDITLLFPLAECFGVSLDELMGYDARRAEAEIEEILAEYDRLLCDVTAGSRKQEFIAEAYRQHPNDFRIIDAYMWSVAGGLADNDNTKLRDHADELHACCGKILDNSTDDRLRLSAWNLKAKLAHAEGKTDKALEIYRQKFPDWYATCGQKTEQLFSKDTREFKEQLILNMLELADFAANKKIKEIWYCTEGTVEEKAEEGLRFISALESLTTGDERMQYVVRKTFSDHVWKMACFCVDAEKIAPVLDRMLEAVRRCDELMESDPILNGSPLHTGRNLRSLLLQWEEADYPGQTAVRENGACRLVLEKWRRVAEGQSV